MAITNNNLTKASAPPVAPTLEYLTATIEVFLASAAAAAQPDAPSTNKPTFLAVIDLYLTSINITTQEGINTYKTMINLDHAWICQTISIETATHMIDLFKDKDTQYGLDDIFRVLKSGTGVADANPCTLLGIVVYHFDLAYFTNHLEDYHHLTEKQVMNFSGWIYDDESLNKSTDMVVKPIDPNAEGNKGMVNRLNIRLCILSGVVHMNFNNHVTLQSYKSFLTENKSFCYTDEVTNMSVFCRLILLKLTIGVMKPQLIVSVQDLEKRLEKLSLQTCGNNVRELTAKMSDLREQIFTQRGDKNSYYDNWFLRILFQALDQTTNPDLGLEVKLEK